MEEQKNQKITNLFVTYELALKLKEKEFDEPCFAYYQDTYGLHLQYIKHEDKNPLINNANTDAIISAPLYQQVIDWLFKKLDFNYPYLKIEIFSDGSGSWYQSKDDGNEELDIDFDNLNHAIEKALKLI